MNLFIKNRIFCAIYWTLLGICLFGGVLAAVIEKYTYDEEGYSLSEYVHIVDEIYYRYLPKSAEDIKNKIPRSHWDEKVRSSEEVTEKLDFFRYWVFFSSLVYITIIFSTTIWLLFYSDEFEISKNMILVVGGGAVGLNVLGNIIGGEIGKGLKEQAKDAGVIAAIIFGLTSCYVFFMVTVGLFKVIWNLFVSLFKRKNVQSHRYNSYKRR